MDYKEKYKQALERARIGLHDCNLLDCDDMTRRAAITTIYHLFPELAEDEDERIRKGIIRNLQYLMDRSEGFVKEDLQERIAWLEKQGESTITNIEIPFGANDSELQEVSYYIPEGFYAEIKDDRVVIKKVEPKFKNGQWIVWQDKCYKVNYNGCGYELIDQNGLSTSLEYGTIDKNAHLWDITKDAKDGDVLATSVGAFIYDSKNGGDSRPGYYCGINTLGKFQVSSGKKWTNKEVYPATKEQRDLLFAKMHDAGYEWDAEKKWLSKKP